MGLFDQFLVEDEEELTQPAPLEQKSAFDSFIIDEPIEPVVEEEAPATTAPAIPVSPFESFITTKKQDFKNEHIYDDFIVKAASEYNLKPSLIKGQIKQESAFENKAVGADKKLANKGYGLMQIRISTAKEIANDLGEEYTFEKLFDPETNIRWGTYYTNKQLGFFNDNVEKGLASYNGGAVGVNAAVEAAIKRGGDDWRYEILNNRKIKTINNGRINNDYIDRVLRFAKEYEGPALTQVATVDEQVATPEQPAEKVPASEVKQSEFADIANAFKVGGKRVGFDLIANSYADGQITEEQYKQAKDEYRKFVSENPVNSPSFPEKIVTGGVGILPMIIKAGLLGKAHFAGGFLAGGAVGLVGGVAALPGALVGGSLGETFGTVEAFRKMGRGTIFESMMENGAKFETARNVSAAVSIPYAFIEQTKVKTIIPGFSKFAKNSFAGKIVAGLIKKGIDFVKEVTEEGVQGAMEQGAIEASKFIDDKVKKGEVTKQIGDSAKKIVGTGIAQGYDAIPALIGLGGAGTVAEFGANKIKEAREGGTDTAPEASALTAEEAKQTDVAQTPEIAFDPETPFGGYGTAENFQAKLAEFNQTTDEGQANAEALLTALDEAELSQIDTQADVIPGTDLASIEEASAEVAGEVVTTTDKKVKAKSRTKLTKAKDAGLISQQDFQQAADMVDNEGVVVEEVTDDGKILMSKQTQGAVEEVVTDEGTVEQVEDVKDTGEAIQPVVEDVVAPVAEEVVEETTQEPTEASEKPVEAPVSPVVDKEGETTTEDVKEPVAPLKAVSEETTVDEDIIDDVPKTATLAQLDEMSPKQLRKVAKDNGIEIYKNMQRATIIKQYVEKSGTKREKREVTRLHAQAKAESSVAQPVRHNVQEVETTEDTGDKEVFIAPRRGTSAISATAPKASVLEDILSPTEMTEMQSLNDTETEVEYTEKNHGKLIDKGVATTYIRDGKVYVEPLLSDDTSETITAQSDNVGDYTYLKPDEKISKDATIEEQVDIAKKISKRYNLPKNIRIVFAPSVLTSEGEVIQLEGEKRVADGMISEDRKTIYLSPTLTGKRTATALIHEIVHANEKDFLEGGTSRLVRDVDTIFKSELQSEYVKKIEKDYKDDIAKVRKKDKTGDPDNAEYEYVKSEWLASRIHQLKAENITEDGNVIVDGKKDPVLTRIVKAIMRYIKKITGTRSTEAKRREMLNKVVAEIQAKVDVKVEAGTTAKATKVEGKKKKSKAPTKKEVTARQVSKGTSRNKIESTETLGSFKALSSRYINKHVHSITEKNLLTDLVKKVDNVEKNEDGTFKDPNARKFTELLDKTQARADMKRTIKFGEGVLSKAKKTKMSEETKKQLVPFQELTDDANLMNRLDRLNDYKRQALKRNPTTKEQVVGDTMKPLKDAGYIEQFEDDGIQYFRLTEDKGVPKLKALKEAFDNHSIKGTRIDAIRYYAEESIKAQNTWFDEVMRLHELKKQTKETAEAHVTEMVKAVDNLVNLPQDVFAKALDAPILKEISKFTKHTDMNSGINNIQIIAEMLDNMETDGPFQKYISKELYDALDRMETFQRQTHDQVFKRFEKVLDDPKNLEKYSETMHPGYIRWLLKTRDKNTKQKQSKSVEYHPYKDINGKKFSINGAERISLFLNTFNPDNNRHQVSENGGFEFMGEEQETYKLDQAIVEEIVGKMSEEEKRIAKEVILPFYNEFQSAEMNKVSREAVGYDIATEENYTPILTTKGSEIFQDRAAELTQVGSAQYNPFFNNQMNRTHADNPLILQDAFQVMMESNTQVAEYVGFAQAVVNINRVLNTKIEIDGQERNLKQHMRKQGLGRYAKMIDAIVDVHGAKKGEWAKQITAKHPILSWLRSAKTVGSLAYRPSVMAIQPISLIAAFTELNTGMLKVPISPKDVKGIWTELEEISERDPEFFSRFRGGFDRDMVELFTSSKFRKMVEKSDRLHPQFFKELKKGNIAQAGMIGIGKTDAMTIGTIAFQIRKDLESKGVKHGSEEYWNKLLPELKRVTRLTQPNYNTVTRPLIASIEWLKTFTMFTTQPLQNLMMTKRSVLLMRKGLRENNKTVFRKGFKTFLLTNFVQPLAITALREAVRRARGKDDDESLLEKYLKGWAISNAGMYPIVGTFIAEIIRLFNTKKAQKNGFVDETTRAGAQAFLRTGLPLQLGNDFFEASRSMNKVFRGNANRKETERAMQNVERLMGDLGAPIGLKQYIEYTTTAIDAVEGFNE